MREKLRSGILVRAVGLFCVATAKSEPDQRANNENDIPKAWLDTEKGKEGRQTRGQAFLLSPRYAHSEIPERNFSSSLTSQRRTDPSFESLTNGG